MKVVALVLSALVLVSLYHEVHSQCGSWMAPSYTVSEDAVLVTPIAQFSGTGLTFLLWATRDGSATDQGDYLESTGVLQFDGDSQQEVTIPISNDDVSEGTESFFVDLMLFNGTICSSATIFILDDEPAPTTPPATTTPPPSDIIVEWEQSKYIFDEQAGFVMICANSTGGMLSSGMTVTVTDVAVEGLNATLGVDFFADAADEWTFAPNETQCFNLLIIDDDEFEGPCPEVIRASFIQAGIGLQDTLICIVDNEPVITIEWELDMYSFNEGGNGTYSICAVAIDDITGNRVEERQVVFRSGSATAGEDYIDQSGEVLRFDADNRRRCIEVRILDDDLLESAECFYVDLVSNIKGIEASSTKVEITDNEGEIVLNVEREVYTVVEGNELEVCVVIADGDVAAFSFSVTGHIYFPGFLALYYSISFSIGDSRSCDSAYFPGNDYLDKLERKSQITFVVEGSESNSTDFIQFDRDSAWCFIADDDIVRIGFSEATYTAMEDGGSVSVCLELCEGSLNRPIDVLLYTSDGSAIEGTNYEGTVRIVTLLASGVAGDLACTDIAILDDGVRSGVLDFSLSIFISDTHVLIPDNKLAATVFIQPAFEICFDMDSPRVNGSELFLSFDSTVPVDSAICSVEDLPDQNCTNGSATFTFVDAARTQAHNVMIVATFGSETRTLVNRVRSELGGICYSHLINKGVMIDGNNATIYLQPTGPEPSTRQMDLECRCRPIEPTFTSCHFGTSATVQLDYIIPMGCTRLSVRQIDGDNSCTLRRALQIDFANFQ